MGAQAAQEVSMLHGRSELTTEQVQALTPALRDQLNRMALASNTPQHPPPSVASPATATAEEVDSDDSLMTVDSITLDFPSP